MASPRTVLLLFAAGLAWHLLWVLLWPGPVDLDAQYYLLVARHLAAGEGAVTDSLWSLAILPERLPAPADLHWMPGPSRILVPEVWLWPTSTGQVTNALLAALLGPLAWALAHAADLSERTALAAGLLAATGGIWVGLLIQPDAYALTAVLGAVALVAAARDRAGPAALAVLLLALTRADGFLVGLALAAAFPDLRAALVGGAGLIGTGLWALRNHLLVGAPYWTARRQIAASGDYLDVYDGVVDAPLTLPGRLAAAAQGLPSVVEYWATPTVLLLLIPTLVALVTLRQRPWVRAAALAFVLVPLIGVVLAPPVVQHGTLYRTGAALLIAHAVLAAAGLEHVATWLHDRRDYPRWLPGLALGGGFLLVVAFVGWQRRTALDFPDECALVADLPPGPVLTTQPLAMELRCGRPGVMFSATTPDDLMREVARRYGATHAIAWPDGRVNAQGQDRATLQSRFPDWTPDGAQRLALPPAP